jgi:hypothetical protein
LVACWPLVAPPLLAAAAEAVVDLAADLVEVVAAADEAFSPAVFEAVSDLLAPSAGAEAELFVAVEEFVLADPLAAGAAGAGLAAC